MQRLASRPGHVTTTDDFLILVTNGAQPPDLGPSFLTKSGVKGPLQCT